MLNRDLTALQTAPAKEIARLVKFYAVVPRGDAGVRYIHKSWTDPRTRKVHVLKRSTGQSNDRDALAVAIPWYDAWMASLLADKAPVFQAAGNGVRLAEVKAAYMAAPTVRAKEATRARNWAELENWLRVIYGEEADLGSLSAEVLSKQVVKVVQSRRLEELQREFAGDLAGLEQAKRGLNRWLARIQSVFSREALDDMERLHLPPGVREFASALPVPARKPELCEQLPDELVARLATAMEREREARPGVWAAFTLMLYGGLRNCEAVAARRSWLTREVAGWRLKVAPTEEFLPKRSSGSTLLPLVVGDQLLELTSPDGSDHLVPAATDYARSEHCYRDLSEWLRAQGVQTELGKVSYRLRKYFVSMVSRQQGLVMAMVAARHGDMATTQANYVGAPRMEQPVKIG